ncbi:MAG TPA: IPT/TIG domain-containing protein [Thermoanaerobaculia bacterium]|nr:IPT/TIG domain-containing protein [Thermoanaerobaculia bacterium]
MRAIAIASLLFAASLGAAEITHVTPDQGFSFYGALVTITGTDLAPSSADCFDECAGALPCPVTVFFGNQQGVVLEVSPERIVAFAPAQAESTVDVHVRANGRPDVTLHDAFEYSRYATVGADAYRRYLVPLTTVERAGAHGSRWVTEWLAHNQETNPLTTPAPLGIVEAHSTAALVALPRSGGVDGAFLYVPEIFVSGIPMSLRARDTSRSGQNLGTEIPIVGEDEFATKKHILDIPTDPRYRATLRVYGLQKETQNVRLRVYSMATGALLDDRVVQLTGDDTDIAYAFPPHPAYAQIDPLSAPVRAAGQRVRIEVEGGTPVWAMVSVTNNVTHEVTTITPHRW